MPKTKTVYQTDADGLYLYPVEANELALAEGIFNIPYAAVEDQPPVAPAGMVARRAEGIWALAEDRRRTPLWLSSTGEPYALGREVEVNGSTTSYPGWGTLPDWLTDAAP